MHPSTLQFFRVPKEVPNLEITEIWIDSVVFLKLSRKFGLVCT
jgi:hypothetical protein